jgi:hypothetical protein
LNPKDILAQKQQDTAAAVTQMRERLKAMGILEKTTQVPPPRPPPPLPPPSFPSEDADSKRDDVDADDETASTVSGGSDVVMDRDEGLKVDQEGDGEAEDGIDEDAYRQLLR